MRSNSVFSGMNYYERQAYRAKRKAEIATEKAKKSARAMTCQCCARQIFAETGTIAHHGYERPGYGYQTASCMGAKYLPFEVSRDRLGDLIAMLKDRKAHQIAARAKAAAEAFPVIREYTNYNAPAERGAGGRRIYLTVKIEWTRASFDALLDQHTGRDQNKLFDSYTATAMRQEGFDKIKDADLASRDQQIKMTSAHLAECESRYAGWKQTHIRGKGVWIAT